MSVEKRESIFFDPQGPLGYYLRPYNIMGWYFVSIKSPKEAPKKTFMSSISGMFSSKSPSKTLLYHGPEPYYLFEKDESRNDYKQVGFRHVEIPVPEIYDLEREEGEIISEEDKKKRVMEWIIKTGGKRSHRTSKRFKKSKKSKKSRKVRHH